MEPHLIGELADKAIPLLGGLFATWLGFRPLAAGDGEPRGARSRAVLKVVGPLLMVWSLGSLAMVAARGPGTSAESIDRAAVLEGINAQLPMAVDEDTRMDRVEDAGSHIVYRATLVRLGSEQGLPEGALDELATSARARVCAAPEQRSFLETMGPLRMEYSYADGGSAGGFAIEACD